MTPGLSCQHTASRRCDPGSPAKPGTGTADFGLDQGGLLEPSASQRSKKQALSPFNPDNFGSIVSSKLTSLQKRPKGVTEEDWAEIQEWLHEKTSMASGAQRTGGIFGARKWDAGIPAFVDPYRPSMEDRFNDGLSGVEGRRARGAAEAYRSPSVLQAPIDPD